jgi:hypothetical protein
MCIVAALQHTAPYQPLGRHGSKEPSTQSSSATAMHACVQKQSTLHPQARNHANLLSLMQWLSNEPGLLTTITHVPDVYTHNAPRVNTIQAPFWGHVEGNAWSVYGSRGHCIQQHEPMSSLPLPQWLSAVPVACSPQGTHTQPWILESIHAYADTPSVDTQCTAFEHSLMQVHPSGVISEQGLATWSWLPPALLLTRTAVPPGSLRPVDHNLYTLHCNAGAPF